MTHAHWRDVARDLLGLQTVVVELQPPQVLVLDDRLGRRVEKAREEEPHETFRKGDGEEPEVILVGAALCRERRGVGGGVEVGEKVGSEDVAKLWIGHDKSHMLPCEPNSLTIRETW